MAETDAALKVRLAKENCKSSYGRLQNVVLGGTTFCDHGNEYCHMCTCDHRMTNNSLLGVDGLDPGAEREPICIGFPYTMAVSDKTDKTLECADHCVLGCRLCFDFHKLIRRNLMAGRRIHSQ